MTLYNALKLLFITLAFSTKNTAPSALQQSMIGGSQWGSAYLVFINNQTKFNVDLKMENETRTIDKESIFGREIFTSFSTDQVNIVAESLRNQLDFTADGYDKIFGNKKNVELNNTKLTRKPSLKGLGISWLDNFGLGETLFFQSLKGIGGVWLSGTDFDTPCSLSFKAFIQDNGEVAVIFNNKETDPIKFKFIFGAENNSKFIIMAQEKEILSVDTDKVPDLKLISGRFKNFWITFLEKNLVLIGQSEKIGENPILFTKIPDFETNSSRIGFQNSDDPSSVSDIRILPPLKLIIAKDQKLIQKGFLKRDIPLFSQGAGSIILKADNQSIQQLQNLKIAFFNEEGASASVEIKDKKMNLKIFFNDNQKEVSQEELFELEDDKSIIFSVNNDNFIIAKADERLEQTELVGIVKNDFWKSCSSVTISSKNNITGSVYLSSPLQFQTNFTAGVGKRGRNVNFAGKLQVVRPFYYQFDQKGPAVICEDKINKTSFVIAEAPQQGSIYPLKVTIKPSGFLETTWLKDPKNPKKMAMKAAVGLLRLQEGQLYSAADQIPEENAEEVSLQMSLTTENIKMALEGAGFRIASAALESELGSNFRSDKFYVAKDTMTEEKTLKQAPLQAQLNKDAAEQKVRIIEKIKLEDRKSYDQILGEYRAMINLVDHPFVASSTMVKNSIMTGVDKLFAYKKNVEETYKIKNLFGQEVFVATKGLVVSFFKFILEICNNPFFMTTNDPASAAFKSKMFNYLTLQSNSYFSDFIPENEILVPASNNVILWSSLKIKNGEGSILASVKGSGDFYIVLAEDSKMTEMATRAPFKNEAMITIGIGEDQNKKMSIRTAFLGTPVKEIPLTQGSQNSMNTFEAKNFWINFEQGTIKIGVGALGENEILSWKDQFVRKENYAIGFFTPVNDITVKNITADKALKNISPETFDFIKSYAATKEEFLKTAIVVSKDSPFKKKDCFNKNSKFLVTKILAEKETSLKIVLRSGEKKIITIGLTQKENTVDGSFFLEEEQKPTKSFSLKNKDFYPFWLEVDERTVSLGGKDIWELDSDAAIIIPNLPEKIDIEFLTEKDNFKIDKPFILPPKKEVNFTFLFLISGGKIKIPTSQILLDKAKKEASDQEIKEAIDYFKKKDSTYMDLSIQEQLVIDDFIKNCNYKEAVNEFASNYISISYANIMQDEPLKTTDILRKDNFLDKNILEEDALGDNPINPTPSRVLSGAEKKLAAAGLAGLPMQLRGEINEFKQVYSTAKTAARGLKKLFKGSDTEVDQESEEIAQKKFEEKFNTDEKMKEKTLELGFGKDVRMMKYDFNTLFGGKNDFMPEINPTTFRTKQEIDPLTGAPRPSYKMTFNHDGTSRPVYANVFREVAAKTKDLIKAKTQKNADSSEKKEAASSGAFNFASSIINLKNQVLREVRQFSTRVKNAAQKKSFVEDSDQPDTEKKTAIQRIKEQTKEKALSGVRKSTKLALPIAMAFGSAITPDQATEEGISDEVKDEKTQEATN